MHIDTVATGGSHVGFLQLPDLILRLQGISVDAEGHESETSNFQGIMEHTSRAEEVRLKNEKWDRASVGESFPMMIRRWLLTKS